METKRFYGVDEVMDILKVKQAKAYCIIKELNNELKGSGYLIINGKIPVKYFEEKFYC